MPRPRLLNGCCKSVVLAEAFERQGWDAWTCDILPSEGWHKHIQDDVLKYLAGVHLCPNCGGACEADHNSFQCHSCSKLFPLSFEHEFMVIRQTVRKE